MSSTFNLRIQKVENVPFIHFLLSFLACCNICIEICVTWSCLNILCPTISKSLGSNVKIGLGYTTDCSKNYWELVKIGENWWKLIKYYERGLISEEKVLPHVHWLQIPRCQYNMVIYRWRFCGPGKGTMNVKQCDCLKNCLCMANNP
jgi:hypothetical protein